MSSTVDQREERERAPGPDVLSMALDGLATGVVLVGRRLEIDYENAMATLLLGRGDGGLSRVSGRLHTTSFDLGARLGFAVRQAHDGLEPRERVFLAAAPGRPPAVAVHVGVPPGGRTGRDATAPVPLYLRALGDPRQQATVQALFKLTNAESRIATALMRGLAIPEVAETIGISVNTARTHLARIFAKTETRQQASLVALLKSVELP